VAILDASPWAVAVSSDGTIYFTELETNRVRMVRDGQVTTVAESGVQGYAEGAALQAQFYHPRALAISPNGGAIYVADEWNNRIRMIRDGQVTTVAGSGVEGYADGAALRAQFNNPKGLAISPNGGAIYVADEFNKRIRMICVPNASAVDLRQAIDAQPSLFIKIGDVSLGFHECLIAHRCSQLKQVLELTGSSLTIEARAARALQSFVYTDTLPDQQKLCSVEWLCLMVWLHMFVIMMNRRWLY
jgi:DNA-binding beta-propeller fold protein YncE